MSFCSKTTSLHLPTHLFHLHTHLLRVLAISWCYFSSFPTFHITQHTSLLAHSQHHVIIIFFPYLFSQRKNLLHVYHTNNIHDYYLYDGVSKHGRGGKNWNKKARAWNRVTSHLQFERARGWEWKLRRRNCNEGRRWKLNEDCYLRLCRS